MNTDPNDDPIDARARAAADALIASYGDLDTESALSAAKSSTATYDAPRAGRARWSAIAAAAVLVVGGTIAVAATRSRSTQDPAPAQSPTTTPTPTAATTVPFATTLPSDSTAVPATTATTTTPTVSPTTSIGAVSYKSPPPVLPFQTLGTVEVPESLDGAFAVAIGELGVAVNRWAYHDSDARPLDVVGFDGQTRTIANADGGVIVAYGPGDVAYLTRQGATVEEFAVVAVPLSGDNAGTFIATQPANINQFVEYPPLSFGHGLDGVIHRRQYLAGTAVTPYVDSDGRPTTLNSVPATFVFDDDLERGLGGVIQSSTGVSWTLVVEAAGDRADTYLGVSPPAAGPDGRGVYVTHIGPNASPDVDFGEPTMWVVAELNPDGTSTWWSLPDGWEILASDTWGTVLGRQTGTQLELALADFGSSSNPVTTACPAVAFDTIPAPWDPTIRDGQGGGSGLPGSHIERPGAFINLFPGGSIFEPASSSAVTVDGHEAQIGSIEEGLGVRVSLASPCGMFDFVAYGVAQEELLAVLAAVQFD